MSATRPPEPHELDPVEQAGRRAKGRRPQFFEDPAVERVMSIAMALAGELSVARERLDTLERVLVARGLIEADAIERFVPDAAAQAARHEMGRAYIARVVRLIDQDVQALRDGGDPPLEHVVDELGRG
jgi:polyhydroxyalkanoate synthesis regulator phasin